MSCSVALLFGSYRPQALGKRVLRFLEHQLQAQGCTPLSIDAAALQIPFLEDTYDALLNAGKPHIPGLGQTKEALAKAKAILLISGEYNHLPQPGLLNLLNYFDKEYHGKPSGLVGYSTGRFGGVRIEAPLRTISGVLGMPSIAPMLCIAEAHKTLSETGHTENAMLLKHL